MNDQHNRTPDAAVKRRPSVIKLMNQVLSWVSGGMVGILMFLIFADVVGRYVFNKPIFGAYELVEVLMGWIIFAGLPIVSRKKGHITVDFLSAFLPDRLKSFQRIVVNLLCAVTGGVMTWRIWVYGARLTNVNETTLELQISKGVIAQAMAVMLALTTLAFILNAWDSMETGKFAPDKE